MDLYFSAGATITRHYFMRICFKILQITTKFKRVYGFRLVTLDFDRFNLQIGVICIANRLKNSLGGEF